MVPWVLHKYSVPDQTPAASSASLPSGFSHLASSLVRTVFFLSQLVIDRGTIRFSISRDSIVAASVASSTRLLRSRRRRRR